MDYGSVQLEQLLVVMRAVLSGDNVKIQEATQFLKVYTKHKESIRLLSYVLANNPEVPLRQLATVLLNRNLINLYQGLTEAEQLEFRTLLLVQFDKQNSLPIQKGIATLVGQLLPVVQLKNWPQLQHMFQQSLATTPDSPATLVLLYSLLYHFTPPPVISSYLLKCLQVEKLVDYALKCLVAIVETQDMYDDELAVVLVAGWENRNYQEDQAFKIIEVFTAMAEKRGKVKPEVIVWVCRKIVREKRLPEKLRICGVDFLFTVMEHQTKLLAKNQALLKEVVETACLTCSEPPLHPDQQDEQSQPIQQVTLWLIQTMAINIKTKKIYPVLFESITALINSNDIHQMNTGFLVLAGCAQGCSQRLRKNLPNPIMNTLIPKGLANSAPQVRGAAISALCYFSQFLIPDIIDYHSTIIPSMMNHISDLSQKVAEKALMALDIFFENLEPEQITDYLPVVVPHLLQVLKSDKSSILMKTASLSALGSLVIASQQKFQPYLQSVCSLCNQIIKIPHSPQLDCIRAQNISLMGRLANEFCKKQSSLQKLYFQNMVLPHLQTIYQILTNQHEPQLREACLCFFYLLANAIGQEFEAIFDKIIEIVMRECEKDVGVGKKKDNAAFSLDTDSEDEEVQVKLTELDEKASAIHAMGELAKSCPLKFVPYFQKAYQILQQNYSFFYENIRIQVLTCYQNLTLGLIKSQNNNSIPSYTQGLPCAQRYPQPLQKHFNTELVPRLLFVMTEDDSREVQACAIEVFDNLVKEVGPVLVDGQIEQIVTAVVMLLEGGSGEVEDEDEEEEGEEEDEDTEVYTFEPLCDFIPRLAKVLRVGFEPSYKQILPSMMKYTVDREDTNDYIQIIGSFAQIFKYIPGTIDLTQEELLPRIEQLKLINDELLSRNLAYCLGMMFQGSPKTMQPYLQTGLVTLKQIFQVSLVPATKQNAVASICRIVQTYNPPIPLQLLIQNTLKIMPFVGDMPEQRTVLKFFMHLAETQGQLLKPHIQKLIGVIESDLSQSKKFKIKEPLMTQLREFLVKLKTVG